MAEQIGFDYELIGLLYSHLRIIFIISGKDA